MRFYMYLEGAWVEKKAQLMAMSEDAMDETLDTASVQIFFDERQYPYPPRTLCKIEHGYYDCGVKTEVSYYFTATDAVTIQVLDPRAFKHVLTLVQTTRELSHHALPNMVFTQPRERTASTYFCCENAINVAHYYQQWSSQPQGYYAWKGFTTRSYIVSAGTHDYGARVGIPSPYWLECLPMTAHSQVGKAVIRLKQKAMFVSGTATSPKGEWKDVNRALAYPSAYFTPKLQVYHHKSDVGKLDNDGQFKDTKSIILSVPITSVTWTDDGGIYELSASDISKINSYTSGYLACELITEHTGETTDEMVGPVSGEFVECLFDRLFVDESEFTSNGIQSVFAYVSLELTYKRATLADVINKIAKRQQCAYDNSINDTLFHLEDDGSDDYELLSTTESPEFSFSGSTVFEALSEVLSTVDALPRFEGDGTGEGGFKLTLDYYNKTGSEIDASTKFTAYSSNATEQKFDNSMITSYQNAEMVSHFPGKPLEGSPKYARARVASYGIPELSDYVLAVDKPIKFINRLWLKSQCAYNAVFDSGKTYSWGEFQPVTQAIKNIPFPVDVASFVFDETTYSSALAQGGKYPNNYNHNIRIQYNCLKFKKGGMTIQCGNKATNEYNNVYGVLWNCWQAGKDRAIGRYCLNNRVPATASDSSMPQHPNFVMSFCDEWKFKDVWFSCEYGTDASGRLEVESPFAKKDGEARVSSSSASVDIGKLGLNMLGVALRSGEPTMTCGQALSSWDNRIRVGQVLWLPNQTGASGTGEKWVATKASYTTFDADGGVDAIKGTIQFAKNFNGLSKRIALDQSKRLWNIDRGISDLCEVNVMTYVYALMGHYNRTFSDVSDSDMPISDAVLGGLFMKALSPNTGTHTDISYATLSSSGSNNEVYIPLNVYGSGNCVCFEAKMGDPISAGVKMTASTDGSTYWWATDTWQKAVGNTYYYGTDVKYADDEGYAETFSVTYYNADDLATSENFPEVDWSGGKPSSKFAITGMEFDKQPNEIFGLNYEIAFLSKHHKKDNEVFFSKLFFDSFTASKKSTLTGLLFYYSTSEDDYYSQADTKGKGSVLPVTASVANASTAFWIAFTADLLPIESKSVTMKAIAICDQNGNILVSANASASARWEKGKAIYLPRLHFFARKERI